MNCCYTKFLYDLPEGSPLRCLIESVIRGSRREGLKILWEILRNPGSAKIRLRYSTPLEIREAYGQWLSVFRASGGDRRLLLSEDYFREFLQGRD